jgi:hypothetical protein
VGRDVTSEPEAILGRLHFFDVVAAIRLPLGLERACVSPLCAFTTSLLLFVLRESARCSHRDVASTRERHSTLGHGAVGGIESAGLRCEERRPNRRGNTSATVKALVIGDTRGRHGRGERGSGPRHVGGFPEQRL